MTALAISLCVLCQFILVIGQLLLKRAMNTTVGPNASWGKGMARLTVAIALMSLWFFLWLGLLQSWEISHLFPFEGLNPAVIAIAAWIFLRERMPLYAWTGILLITLGLALVAGS